jgi:lipopolysaccharide/colanic/teichoic acid biosynthesis glycosyltransferase
MENRTNNSHVHSETAVAVGRAGYSYGSASGVSVNRPLTLPIPSAELIVRLRFLSGEIFGICFVIFSTLYIFAMPAALSKPGWLKAFGKSIVKRTLDIIGAIAGLVVFLPVSLLVPILIKLDSAGPVFYSQTRVGVNRRKNSRRYMQKAGTANKRTEERRHEDYMGKPFKVLKFRTMVQDAEKLSGPVWATKNDGRITRVGRLLRKTRLDEVPQFVNILRGDMSLVGPRPERPSFVRDLSTKVDDYAHRLSVKPGLTGLAQVENGYDSSLDSVTEKVKFDLHYIRNWSLWSDMKIILKTVVVVVTGKGAC